MAWLTRDAPPTRPWRTPRIRQRTPQGPGACHRQPARQRPQIWRRPDHGCHPARARRYRHRGYRQRPRRSRVRTRTAQTSLHPPAERSYRCHRHRPGPRHRGPHRPHARWLVRTAQPPGRRRPDRSPAPACALIRSPKTELQANTLSGNTNLSGITDLSFRSSFDLAFVVSPDRDPAA